MLKENEMRERAKRVGDYIIKNNATIRETAKVFKVSKSTIHMDITERLIDIDMELYWKVREVLDYNISQRAIRGGEATRRKYKK